MGQHKQDALTSGAVIGLYDDAPDVIGVLRRLYDDEYSLATNEMIWMKVLASSKGGVQWGLIGVGWLVSVASRCTGSWSVWCAVVDFHYVSLDCIPVLFRLESVDPSINPFTKQKQSNRISPTVVKIFGLND